MGFVGALLSLFIVSVFETITVSATTLFINKHKLLKHPVSTVISIILNS